MRYVLALAASAWNVALADTVTLECHMNARELSSFSAPSSFSETVRIEVEEIKGEVFIDVTGTRLGVTASSATRTIASGSRFVGMNLSTPNSWHIRQERFGGPASKGDSDTSVSIDRRSGFATLTQVFKSRSLPGASVQTEASGRCEAVAGKNKF